MTVKNKNKSKEKKNEENKKIAKKEEAKKKVESESEESEESSEEEVKETKNTKKDDKKDKKKAKDIKKNKNEAKDKKKKDKSSSSESSSEEESSSSSSSSEEEKVEKKTETTPMKVDESKKRPAEETPTFSTPSKTQKTAAAQTPSTPSTPGAPTEVYLGKLSFNSTEESIREGFAGFGTITNVKVLYNKDTGQAKGAAFVQFETNEAAQAAIDTYNGQDFEGRYITAEFSKGAAGNAGTPRTQRSFGGQSETEPSRVLFLGGLSYSSTQDSIRSAFADYETNISDIRIPLNEDGEPRGFGHIEFDTVETATKALETLNGARIDGRSVRLDYSEEKKPRRDSFGGGGSGAGRGRGGGRGFDRGGRNDRGRGNRGGRGPPRGGRGNAAFAGKKTTFE